MAKMEIEKKNKGILTIYDAERQSWQEIDQKEQKMSAFIHNQVLMGVFISAAAIKKMFDDRLYLGLGCESRDEYIDTMLPYGRRQAYRLYAIGNKFNGLIGAEIDEKRLLGAGDGNLVPPVALNEEGTDGEDGNKVSPTTLGNLGIRKLYEMTRFNDDEFEELINTGKTKLGDAEITIDEIKEESARELSKKISAVKRQFTGKISQLTEENLKLKEEMKLMKKTDDELKTAGELEKLYGGIASKLEDKKERLTSASKLLNEFIETLVRSGIDETDPILVQQELLDIVRRIDSVYSRAQQTFEGVITNVSGYEL
jgi:hypothetical protein